MIRVWLKNNDFQILSDVVELKDLIESEMGEDVASEIQKLIDDSNRIKVLESFEESIETLILDIRSSKRLKKDEILNSLEQLIENLV